MVKESEKPGLNPEVVEQVVRDGQYPASDFVSRDKVAKGLAKDAGLDLDQE